MRNVKTLAGILVTVATTVSCGSVVREGRAPVFMVIDSLQASRGAATTGALSGFLLSDVLTYVTTPAPCSTTSPCPTIFNDTGTVTLRLSPKNIGTTLSPAAPSTNNDVTVTRYHIVYRRADGRNTPGVDVPYGFDGAATGTIQVSSTLSLGFELVRHVAKEESPLVQLVASPTIISTIADITFYGRDQVGNDISATGSILVDFGNFGDF
jgi:hypothetical protein